MPIYLVPLLFPLLNLKEITFFTKFNSLGVVSIVYMLFFVIFTSTYGQTFDNSPFGGIHLAPFAGENCSGPAISNLTGHAVAEASYFGPADGAGGHGLLGAAGVSDPSLTLGCDVEFLNPGVFSLTGVLMLSYRKPRMIASLPFSICCRTVNHE